MYRTALIGLGRIAWRYSLDNPSSQPPLTHMAAFQRHEMVQVVGGFSPDQKDRNDFAQKYGVDTCDRLDVLLDKHPDIVSVCSPSQFHFEQVKACLERKIPMIWLEKPPTLTLEDLDRLIALRDASGGKTKILVNYTRRYWQVYQRLKEIYASQLLGNPLNLDILYSRGLELNGSHFLDYTFHLLSEPSEYEIWCPSNQHATPNPSFQLAFKNGFRVCITGSDAPYHINDVMLTADQGRASILSGGLETRVEPKVENAFYPGFYRLKETEPALLGAGGPDVCFAVALADLIHAHETDVEPRSNLLTARPTQIAIDKVRNP